MSNARPGSEHQGFFARGAGLTDVAGIGRVFEAAFPHWPEIEIDVPLLEHLAWKMDSPGLPAEHHTVVTDGAGGDIVAAKLRWISRGKLNGAEYITDHGVDFAVHPDYQGRGVGRLIVTHEATAERQRGSFGMDFISNNEIARNIHRHADRATRDFRVWARPLRARTLVTLNARAGGPAQLVRGALRAAMTSRSRSTTLPAAMQIVELDRFDERADLLDSRASRDFYFTRIRDARYLNWRHDPRSGPRTILAVLKEDQLLAWAVFRPHQGSLHLVDLLFHPDHLNAGVALLERGLQLGRQANAAALVTWLPLGHPAESLFEATGFVAARDLRVCRFWILTGGDTSFDLIKPIGDSTNSIHMTMADFDFA